MEPNTVSDSHWAPSVLSRIVPSEIPTVKTIIVPQGISLSTSANCCLMTSFPPSILSVSGLISAVIIKNRAIDMIMENGAEYKSHEPHDMFTPNCSWIKPITTIFCTAPVLIPIWQELNNKNVKLGAIIIFITFSVVNE